MFNWFKNLGRDTDAEMDSLLSEMQRVYDSVDFKKFYTEKCFDIVDKTPLEKPWVVKYDHESLCAKFLFFELKDKLELQKLNVSDEMFRYQEKEEKLSELYNKICNLYSETRSISDAYSESRGETPPHQKKMTKMRREFKARGEFVMKEVLEYISKSNVESYTGQFIDPSEARYRLVAIRGYFR